MEALVHPHLALVGLVNTILGHLLISCVVAVDICLSVVLTITCMPMCYHLPFDAYSTYLYHAILGRTVVYKNALVTVYIEYYNCRVIVNGQVNEYYMVAVVRETVKGWLNSSYNPLNPSTSGPRTTGRDGNDGSNSSVLHQDWRYPTPHNKSAHYSTASEKKQTLS